MQPVGPRLTVVGSINLDLVARCERLPRPGETLTDATFARYPGGKGANQAVAAARLGADVIFLGSVGADEFADEALAGLRGAGVETVLRQGGATGVAVIIVDALGENQIVVAPGANAELHAPQAGGAVLSQLEIPVDAVRAAADGAERFFLNAAPARPIPAELVRAAEVVIVNRYELEALPETPTLTALTLGEQGAVLLEAGEEVARAEAPTVQAVDGTAAGDAFTACLVVSRLEGREWGETLRRACAAGALAASRPGAQPSLPTAGEVDAILQR
ncbi:MAG TPA: ribokinase [Gaiellaceae bacterium]|jgi:ribokinase|nr:ribokinase [Gaiellaceae bacterium]